MGAFWIAVVFAYVVLAVFVLAGGTWRMFHPHH